MRHLLEVLTSLACHYEFKGDLNVRFSEFCSAKEQKTGGICFLDGKRVKDISLVDNGLCSVFLLPISMINEFDSVDDDVCVIFTNDPKKLFCDIYELSIGDVASGCVSPSAHIHVDSTIASTAIIGNNVVIHEKCSVGEGTRIKDNVVLYPNSDIGRGCVIEANSSIGTDGFGFYKSDDGNLKNFPHIGGVILQDNVHIGANVSIARGSLSNTVVGKGSKIDNLVHVAHNVRIGRSVMIAASAVICGSVSINDEVWIGPNAVISDGLTIGYGAFITLGSTVVRDVKEQQKVSGYFAIEHRDFIKGLKKIRAKR